MIHDLKIAPPFFEQVIKGNKTFEIRRNDRGFKEGDLVRLMEFSPNTESFSGREAVYRIGYVGDYEQKLGFVVFSLLPLELLSGFDSMGELVLERVDTLRMAGIFSDAMRLTFRTQLADVDKNYYLNFAFFPAEDAIEIAAKLEKAALSLREQVSIIRKGRLGER